MRSSWRQYRQRERQLPTAPQQPPRSLQPLPHPAGGSLDQQQAAIEALLRRVKPESLGSEARHQLLGCVRELHRLSEPDSSGRRLAESLAATLQGGSRDDNLEVPAEQIPEQVDSALEQLLSGMTPAVPPAPAPQPPPPPSQQAPLPTTATPFSSSLSTSTIPPVGVTAALEATPNFSQIGCDPRLLAPIKDSRSEAQRDILVDGEIRRLALDRVQPLLVDKGESRVIRFRFPQGAAVFLEWEGGPDPVRLRIGDFTKVLFGRRPFIVCLGGPGHELIIHGKPFNVPFNEPKLVPIRAGFFRAVYQVRLQAVILPGGLPVTPALDVGPPVPAQWLQWAQTGAFGAVNQLHKPPLNPMRPPGGSSGGRAPGFFNSQNPYNSRLPPPPPSMPPLATTQQQQLQHPSTTSASRSQPPDVLKMLDSLVKAGLVNSANRLKKSASSEVGAVGEKRRTDGSADGGETKRGRLAAGGDNSADEDPEFDKPSGPEDPSAPSGIDYDSDVDLPVDLTDLVEEKLEQRLPAVTYRLVGGFQCPQCTLRFTRGPESASFRRHMDEHYRRRVLQRHNPPAKCRAWYPHWSQLVKPADEFSTASVADFDADFSGGPATAAVAAATAAATDGIAGFSSGFSTSEPDPGSAAAAASASSTAAAAAAAVASGVPARSNPELNVCGVCYEQFDTRWDDDTEDWLLRDCVELGGGIYHPVCAEDAGKATSGCDQPGDTAASSTSATAALLSILKEAVGLQ
ncbi:hypothetical protein BOX15_Mlig014878g1 [Macrostomum lignano]|uniref:Pcf11 C-terminal domain-containing protein n=1 Tax=Macrostomum lignano TaxID=282301 RepID=A0A267EDJ9_9PLAT|nr:hypothetical protein BOX15_Mlig014878g1 [Macrostomum lignano]